MRLFHDLVIGLNRFRNRFRRAAVRPENLLLLVPHCLQRTSCERNIIHDIDQCARCGDCNIAEIIALRDEFGIRCRLASGGRQALDFVRDPAVEAVVAVACEKELADGIRAAASKRIVSIVNERPEGPCKNTCVSLEAVRAAIRELLKEAK